MVGKERDQGNGKRSVYDLPKKWTTPLGADVRTSCTLTPLERRQKTTGPCTPFPLVSSLGYLRDPKFVRKNHGRGFKGDLRGETRNQITVFLRFCRSVPLELKVNESWYGQKDETCTRRR